MQVSSHLVSRLETARWLFCEREIDDLPAAVGRSRVAGAEGLQILGPAGLNHEGAEQSHHRQLAIIAERLDIAEEIKGLTGGGSNLTVGSVSVSFWVARSRMAFADGLDLACLTSRSRH